MRYLKTFEGFGYSDDDYRNEVIRILKQYDIRPVEINKLIEFYEDDMFEFQDTGKTPQNFVDYINGKNELGEPGGNYLKIRMPRMPRATILNNYL